MAQFVLGFPVLQVQGAGFAMVGEQMSVSVVTAAADALRKAEVAVKAEYLEGGGHSELQILVDNADGTTQPLQVRHHDCLWTQGSCNFLCMVYHTMTIAIPMQDVNIISTYVYLRFFRPTPPPPSFFVLSTMWYTYNQYKKVAWPVISGCTFSPVQSQEGVCPSLYLGFKIEAQSHIQSSR